jgi:hypothetical protein
LLRLATDLEEFGKVEAMPVLEGEMIMFIAPKKGKIKITIQKQRKINKTSCKNTGAQPASTIKKLYSKKDCFVQYKKI